MDIRFSFPGSGGTGDYLKAFEAIDLNNIAYAAANDGDYAKSIEMYKRALEIKEQIFGPESYHMCISLSGYADAYLSSGDIESAKREATRMLRIAEQLGEPEQIRIAKEILADCEKAKSKKK